MTRTPIPTDPSAAREAVERWLAAEASRLPASFAAAVVVDDEDEAEAALGALLGRLAPAAPAAGFADRVMARVAAGTAAPLPAPAAVPEAAVHPADAPAVTPVRPARPARPVRSSRATWAWGVAAALAGAMALGTAAVAASTAPRWLPGALGLVGAGNVTGLVHAAIAAVNLVGQWLVGLVSVTSGLTLLVRAVAEPLETPLVAGVVCACLVLAGFALRFLHDVIQRDRRWVYVDPI